MNKDFENYKGLLVTENNSLTSATEDLLIYLINMQENIKKSLEDIKGELLKEMEDKNILKIETDNLTITRIEPTLRLSFDSKQFQSDFPDMYDQYVKTSPVSGSLRFKVKNDKNNSK